MRTTTPITPRELEVLTLIGEGLSSKQVAEQLSLAKRTVDFHLANVYGKLKVTNRLEAVRAVHMQGFESITRQPHGA